MFLNLTPDQLHTYRLFGVGMTAFITLCGLAVVLRPEKKIVTPGHRIGNFIIWMLGKKMGMSIIRFLGWIMLIGGGMGLIAAIAALSAAG